MKRQAPTTPKVVSLAAKRHSKLVLAAFDDLTHGENRKAAEQRSNVERAARNKV
ncbi:MAG: hypothetical protein JWQ01_4827 [Massilia sp.]|nr:hypothetical protein [Massilia sp.]